MIEDEEFLPDKEEAEIKHQVKQDATISLSISVDDILKHNEEVGGTIFKYDLPVINSPIVFKSKQALALVDEAEEMTSVENLFSQLDCDKDTAFESFIVKHH